MMVISSGVNVRGGDDVHQNYKLIIVVILFFTGCVASPLKDTSTLPLEFKKNIPMSLRGDMKLVKINDYKKLRDQSRPILYANSLTGKSEPRTKVSLLDGYRVMYAVPGTAYFAKTHIEKSVPGEYKRDRAVILGARYHNHREQIKQLQSALKDNYEYAQQFESQLNPGRDLLIFTDDSYKNYQFVSSHASVLGLT